MHLGRDHEVTLHLEHDDEDTTPYSSPELLYWSVDDGSVVSLTTSEDRLSCTVRANAPGTAVVTLTDGGAAPRVVASEVFNVPYGDVPDTRLVAGDITHQ